MSTDIGKALSHPELRRGLAILLGVGLAALILAMIPSTEPHPELFSLPKQLTLGVVAVFSGMSLIWMRVDTTDAIDLLVALILLIGLTSALIVARNTWLAWDELTLCFSGALLFWSARQANQELLVKATAFVIVGLAVLALFQTFGLLPDWSIPRRGPGSTFGNRNSLAHILTLGFPATWFVLARTEGRGQKLAWSIASGLIAAMLVFTRSRAAWIAVLTVYALSILALVVRRFPVQGRAALRLQFVGGVSGVLIAVLAPPPSAWTSTRPYFDTLAHLLDSKTGSGAARVIQYGTTFDIAVDHPLLGVGPGNWSVAYSNYARAGDPSFHPYSYLQTDPLPRSDWLAVMAEWGLIATLALLSLGTIFAVRVVSELRSVATGCRSISSATLLAALIIVTLQGCFDVFLLTPAGMAGASILIGASVPGGWLAPPSTRGKSRFAPRLGLLLAVAISFTGSLRTINRIASYRLTTEQPTTERLQRAVALDPSNYFALIRLASYWLAKNQCQEALRYLEAAQGLYPNSVMPQMMRRHCDPQVSLPL